jgi:membrane protein
MFFFSKQTKIIRFLNNCTANLLKRARRISLPGFEGIPIYDVITFFFKGLLNGALTTRASSIAFHFCLALLPAIIYLFTLIPYIPVENFQEGLLSLIEDILPTNVYDLLDNTIKDMFVKRKGLQYFGLIIALFFATNGLNHMIVAFNVSYHTIETRSWLERRAVSALLVIILVSLLTIAVSLILFSRLVVRKMVELEILQSNLTVYVLITGKWIIVVALIFIAVSFLYFLGPSRKMKWKFTSAGSTFSSVLIIVTSLIFSYIINHFNQFNRFFGTIGTAMVILLWLYFNSLALLIGFELNASIKNIKFKILENDIQNVKTTKN